MAEEDLSTSYEEESSITPSEEHSDMNAPVVQLPYRMAAMNIMFPHIHMVTEQPRSEANPCSTCTEEPSTDVPLVKPDCHCPKDHLDITIHEENCLLFKNETLIYPHEVEECECPPEKTAVCRCCKCLEDQCRCKKAGREVFDQWRLNRDVGPLPNVLESTHPLMQKFQESLRRFLTRENEVAEQELISLRDELKQSKLDYDKTLEQIYLNDHDTNGQRVLIEEYEATLAKEKKIREDAKERARVSSEKYKQCKEKLDADMMTERDSTIEVEALTALVGQLEAWREETESDLTVSQRMTEKMKQEKRALAGEKRQLDMLIYGLNNEVWKLQAKIELYKKQMEIKNVEMDKVVDKVTAYQTELEDLELDKKRLISLWNSVLVNIKQRDKVFDSVRDDYWNLQENYRTLTCNLEITKRICADEMNNSKILAMDKDKLESDFALMTKTYEAEEKKRLDMERNLAEIQEAIEMNEQDQEMIKMENAAMRNFLTTTEKEYERCLQLKLKMENEVLENIQNCLLNDKAVDHMANGIRKMRDMSRKLEISLMTMENNHAKIMLDIELYKNKQGLNKVKIEKFQNQIREKESEIDRLDEKYSQHSLLMTRKQRELDSIQKKYAALKEIFSQESPQERRIIDLEQQIKELRDRTEEMQHKWLRLQGHVVTLTQQHQSLVANISLINKQIQICDQKSMFAMASIDKVNQERAKLDRSLRDLHGRLQVLERARKDTKDLRFNTEQANQAVSHEYAANLKDAESELMELEESIEMADEQKINLTKDLDHVTREGLVWQRKCILAVELKRNLKNAKSAAGEIYQMKAEIHRMEVRREQLRRTADKLSEDLALYVLRRETAVDKTRASAAVEKARGLPGHTSQSTYKHKLRLIKADVARVSKELSDAKAQVKNLQEEQKRLENDIEVTSAENARLEENIASTLRECRDVDRDKQWLLERVVRSQRVGKELARAVKRQSLRVNKPKSTVLAEYNTSKALNDRLKHVVDQLTRAYPYMEDKLAIIANTLNILSPTNSPRLTEEETCHDPGCVLPKEPSPPVTPEKPYCRQMKDTCVDCKCTDLDV